LPANLRRVSSPPETAPAARSQLARWATVIGLCVLEACSAGLASWELLARRCMPDYARRNLLDLQDRAYVFLDMAIGLGAAVVVFAVIGVWKRRGALDLLERLARRLTPLALAALAPLLFDARLWHDGAVVFLVFAAIFGFGARAATLAIVRTSPASPGFAARLRERFEGHLRRAAAPLARLDLPLAVTALGACAYAIYFSAITIASHRNLGTSSFDMGLEDNLMWNLVHGGPLFKSTPFDGPTGTHLRNHATFFSYVLAPVYWLAPRPETLLAIQATLMGAAAIPLHLFARRRVTGWVACVVAMLYLAYPPLHGANLYDFHYLPLGVVFLWTVLYAVEARRTGLAVVAALLAVSVREDVAFCLGVLGVLLLLTDRAPRAGGALAVLGGGYFLAMKLVVMPHFGNGQESFTNQYAGLVASGGHGFRAILATIVGNPAFTFDAVLRPEKLPYALLVLVPVLFLPLARPIGLLLLFPGFLFTLLSTGYAPLTQISFQYTSYWTAFVFIGVVLELERTRRARHPADAAGPARMRALVVGLAAASLACTYQYGAVLQHEALRGGFDPFVIGTTAEDLARRADLASLIAEIPPDAKVAASEHVVPHVSGRECAYTLRFGLYDAEYLLIQRPIRSDESQVATPVLRDGSFGVVSERGRFVLARRGAPVEGNGEVLQRLDK
jgi:uncharacterized membrane protein